jgi:rubrerythrin
MFMEVETLHRFSVLEGLRIAVEIERNGERFYREVKGMARSSDAAAQIEALREQEEKHVAIFARMYREMAEKVEEEPSLVFDEETNAYLSAIAAEVVSPGGVLAALSRERPKHLAGVLVAAMNTEKDSILFYMELADAANDPLAREAFRAIIEEEKKHLVTLQAMLEEIGGELL